jgi:hypothetical protein
VQVHAAVAHRPGDPHRDVEPGAVERLERAHRQPEAPDGGVDRSDVRPPRVDLPDGLESEPQADPAEDESRDVPLDEDGRPVEDLDDGPRGLDGPVGGVLAPDHLHCVRRIDGAREAHPDDPSRAVGRRGEVRDRDRSGIGREEGVLGCELVRCGEDVPRAVRVPEGRLDDQVGGRERGTGIGRRLDSPGDAPRTLGVATREALRQPPGCLGERVPVGVGQRHGVAGGRERAGDPATGRPDTDDGHPLGSVRRGHLRYGRGHHRPR